jgi:hypothetical protein
MPLSATSITPFLFFTFHFISLMLARFHFLSLSLLFRFDYAYDAAISIAARFIFIAGFLR